MPCWLCDGRSTAQRTQPVDIRLGLRMQSQGRRTIRPLRGTGTKSPFMCCLEWHLTLINAISMIACLAARRRSKGVALNASAE